MKSFLSLLLGISVVAACSGSPPPIHASSYDQSCAADAECAPVHDGDVCDPCGWNDDVCYQNAVVAVRDKARFVSDRAALHDRCGTEIGGHSCSDICETANVACIAGRCTVCRGTECDVDGSADAGMRD